MSHEAMTWARKQKTNSPVRKAVLMAVANFADENGKAWPSQARLVEDTELSKRSVINALAELEEMGLLARTERRRPDGSRASDIIILSFEQGACGAPCGAGRAGGVVQDVQGGGAGDAPLTTFEPSSEPSKKKKNMSAGADKPSSKSEEGKVVRFQYPGEFEMLWAEYPRHRGVSKSEAYKEWKKLSEAERDDLLEGVISYAEQIRKDKTEERFILWPCRFIKRRIWETFVEVAL